MYKLIGELKIGNFKLEHAIVRGLFGQPENDFQVMYTHPVTGKMYHFPIMQPFKANIMNSNSSIFQLAEYNNTDYRNMLEEFLCYFDKHYKHKIL